MFANGGGYRFLGRVGKIISKGEGGGRKLRSEARGVVACYSNSAPDIACFAWPCTFLGLGMHGCQEEVGCLDKTHQTNNLGALGCFVQVC